METSAQAVLAKHAEKSRTTVKVPLSGQSVSVPVAPDSLAYDLALTGLAAVGVIEWPVGMALVVGHALIRRLGNKRVAAAVSEALESAA